MEGPNLLNDSRRGKDFRAQQVGWFGGVLEYFFLSSGGAVPNLAATSPVFCTIPRVQYFKENQRLVDGELGPSRSV